MSSSIREAASVLPGTEKARHRAPSEPAGIPIQAELIARQDTYPLDLGGHTAEDFSHLFAPGRANLYPPGPAVDLELRLRNTGDRRVAIQRRSGIIYCGGGSRGDIGAPAVPEDRLETVYLLGNGAFNPPLERCQSLVVVGLGAPPEPKPVTLGPGESYAFRVTCLQGYPGFPAYWLLPGEYTVIASYSTQVAFAPDRERPGDDFKWVSFRCPPVKLKVVEAKR